MSSHQHSEALPCRLVAAGGLDHAGRSCAGAPYSLPGNFQHERWTACLTNNFRQRFHAMLRAHLALGTIKLKNFPDDIGDNIDRVTAPGSRTGQLGRARVSRQNSVSCYVSRPLDLFHMHQITSLAIRPTRVAWHKGTLPSLNPYGFTPPLSIYGAMAIQ